MESRLRKYILRRLLGANNEPLGNGTEVQRGRPVLARESVEGGAIQTLIVCEKPDAAARLARALDEDGDPRQTDKQGVPFYEARRGQEKIIVCSALGHLYEVDSKGHTARRYFPVWDSAWRPKHLIDKKSARLAHWIQTIGSLAKQSDRYISACDYDVEGSLIGYTVLHYACPNAHSKAQRMKFSTMTEKEIQTAYRNLAQHLDYPQIEAGRCRHELDWLYGINLSRLLTESALRQHRGYSTLSTGRVQGPTLKFVVEREEEIQCFTPTPFWIINANIEQDGRIYPLDYSKEKILDLQSANKIVSDCKDSNLEVDNRESHNFQQPPPHPFDLSSLQVEAYRHFHHTPARTLVLAEKLYLGALISYPRTSSQQLPPDIGYSEILRRLATMPQYKSLASKLAKQTRLKPNQGLKHDAAHPAIYPTGETPKRSLIPAEAKLLDLIIHRFMATFAEPSLHESSKLTLKNHLHRFFLRGFALLSEGWIQFYRPYASDNSQPLPNLKVGEKVGFNKIETLEKFTEPPPRFNPGSLLRKMEEENIGTKATRAEIIEVLYRRAYIKDARIQATPLAIRIISVLKKHCPLIIDPSFTGELENQMQHIQTNQTTRIQVLLNTAENLRPVMLNLMAIEDELGTQLAEIVAAQRISNTTFEYPCPSCKSKLVIVRSRASGKRFIGCSGYEEGCRFTLPLPQYGNLIIVPMKCKSCGFQLVKTRVGSRRPMISCARCYSTRSKKSMTTSGAIQTRATGGVGRDRLLEGAPLIEY